MRRVMGRKGEPKERIRYRYYWMVRRRPSSSKETQRDVKEQKEALQNVLKADLRCKTITSEGYTERN